MLFIFFFFNDTATPYIYTLSLHDALPISFSASWRQTLTLKNDVSPSFHSFVCGSRIRLDTAMRKFATAARSEEHTSELQSQSNLVCRLLLEKKKKKKKTNTNIKHYY